MSRGDIWWARSPSDKKRPVLVLTRADAVPLLTRVVCVPLTRTIRSLPSEFDLDEDDGVPHACVANFDDVRTIPKSLLVERITRLPADRLRNACEALNAALGC